MLKQVIFFIQNIFRLPFHYLRHNTVSFTSRIMSHVFIKGTTIGKYCFVGSYSEINNASIGNYTCIANGVVIGGMEHPYWDLSISPKLSSEFVYGKKTTIGNDVWIATGSIIKQGVTIGDGSVIGANSFVNKDVPPYAIVFGSPATIHKFRFNDERIKRIQESDYWNNPPKIAIRILNELKKEADE